MTDWNIIAVATDAAFVILSIALLIGFIRLVIGPSLPDRVVAIDLLTLLAMAYSALYAIATDNQAFLDVSIALALVAFLATVAFARFAERRSADRNGDGQAPEEKEEAIEESIPGSPSERGETS